MDLLGYAGLRDQAGDCLRSERFKLWVSEGEEIRALGFGFGVSGFRPLRGVAAHAPTTNCDSTTWRTASPNP